MTRTWTIAALAAVSGLLLPACGSPADVEVVEPADDERTLVLEAPDPTTPGPGPVTAATAPDDDTGQDAGDDPDHDTAVETDDDRLAEVFDAVAAAMEAGDCVAAIAAIDEIVDDPAWSPNGRDVAELSNRRDDCVDFLALVAAPPSPDVLTGLVELRTARPAGLLTDTVDRTIERLYHDHGAALLNADSCTAIDDRFGLLADPLAVDAMAVCANAFAGAGMASAAIALAYEAIDLARDPLTVDLAIQVVRDDPETCGLLAAGIAVADPARWPDHHAGLLHGCMERATVDEDLEQLAQLQLAFLTDLPGHPDATAVATAMLDNVGACAYVDELSTLGVGTDLVASKLLGCAQFADFVGDRDGAIELYESFLDRYPDDQRAAEATAGLARNLVALARDGDWTSRDRPGRTGSTASGVTTLVYSNDTRYEQRIVISGPEARIVTVDASSTSSVYDTPPNSCRVDVPTVVIDLVPGTYDVMVADDVAYPEIGTWTLSAGSEYGWCSYYVWA